VKETKVYILDGGSLVIDGFHMFWNRGPAGDTRIPCYSVLIDHPEGNFIFDTGFDYNHVMRVLPFEKPIQGKDQTIEGALSLVGLKPEAIDYVINSHFHFDHCGGNRHMINAVSICHALEYEACLHYKPFEKLGYSDLSFASQFTRQNGNRGVQQVQSSNSLADSSETRFKKVSGDVEVAKGLTLLETPGHTAGHYSLFVELQDRRPMLFTADAVYSQQGLDFSCISSFHLDPVAAYRSMERIKGIAEQNDTDVFFGHDPESFPKYKKAPEYYA
jgi:4-pyridoxolactonase